MGRSHASGKAERGAKAAGKDRSPDASPSSSGTVRGCRLKKRGRDIRRTVGFHPQSIQDLVQRTRSPNHSATRQAELPLGQVYGDRPVSADPDVHAKKSTEIFSRDVTIIHVHSGQAAQNRVIDFYGKPVIPRPKRG